MRRCSFSRLIPLVFYLFPIVTVSAERDYEFDLYLENPNAPLNVCTTDEEMDLYNRLIPTLLAVLADPKFDLKPTKDVDWKKYNNTKKNDNKVNRKKDRRRELNSNCVYWCRTSPNPYMCYEVYLCRALGYRYRHLRSASGRTLSDAEVLEVKGNVEEAARGLLNRLSKASPYSATCTQALLNAQIGSRLAIFE